MKQPILRNISHCFTSQFFVKLLFLCLSAAGLITSVEAQQVPPQRGYVFQGMLWNPALTGAGDNIEVGAHYFQQWVSFPGAPITAMAYGQLPFSDERMALGLVTYLDKAGPFLRAGGQIQYAYKLPLGLTWKDQLAIGILGRVGRARFDPTQVTARESDDDLLNENLTGEMEWDFGLGIFYTTSRDLAFTENAFYVGMVVDQLRSISHSYGGDQPIWQGVPHGRFLAGYRKINYSRCWEPSIYMDLVPGVIPRIGGNLRYEVDRLLWGQIGADLTAAVRMGGGYTFLIDSHSQKALLIGVDAEYALSSIGRQQGLSYHFSFAWRILKN